MWQYEQAVFYVKFVFANDGEVAVAQQFIVVKQAAGNGVLDGHQSQYFGVFPYGLEHFLKGVAAYQLYFFAAEVLVRGYIVKRTVDTLNGNLFHVVRMFV